ncbi:DNA-processing protein DprA [Balneolaceae bacterium ANBcel3]|nr:DNA-processing protein DprA [Balneolaceae bacterium ANBcel3]
MRTIIEKEERAYLEVSLALRMIPLLGASRIKQLLEAVDDPGQIFEQSAADLVNVNRIGPQIAEKIGSFNDWKKVEAIMEEAGKLNAVMLTPFHTAYPAMLKEIHDPPPVIWVRGSLEVLQKDYLAVVGTRSPGVAGKKMTVVLTKDLARRSHLGIVSGLASGVDTLAHETALEQNIPTIAVLGSGIDWIYPRSNISLAYRIIENGGAIISEQLPGTRPDAGNFPERNRIVSGMSAGVLVIESGIAGGSLITARQALDQNREVFIVPHDPLNSMGEGCNRYIQRGWGKLVLTAGDILEELPVELQKKSETTHISNDSGGMAGGGVINLQIASPSWKERCTNDTQKSICRLLTDQKRALHIDEMAEILSVSSSGLLPELLFLELEGIVLQKPGKKFNLVL